ncbi:MAG TPA: MBL fold metallo-hydrolase [Methanomassiliicoccales archaeon]|jgi:7,8-dihydropterin-6-yl-methyl-4-(beta-D-ribofuranosyl)aminobenzene 5'-phosphate synthase|nr:MBL fold metallo-hydrolase [Methanomassiliicoccales archaeon]
MRLVALVDNMSGFTCQSRLVHRLETPEKHFVAEQGFSMLVETDAGQKVVVDAGGSEYAFTNNLKNAGLEPKEINACIVTHGHYDHVGGLMPLIEGGVPIYTHPKTFVGKRYATYGEIKTDISAPKKIIESLSRTQLHFVSSLTEISAGVRVSGEVPRITDFEAPVNFLREEEGKTVEDTVADEQAVYLTSKKGLVVIAGCAHQGIVNIVTHAKKATDKRVYMVIGGLHLANATPDRVLKTMDQLKNLGVDRIAPMHCTGFEAMKMISDRFVGFELMPAGSEIEFA